ncbi:hypothetical protein [Actinomadura mexicana]|uniref:hypothetical protein n=1 Tax=Actinomadura mexicana TaxID=134959 RepID=UPI00117786E1|nr:hypothetical protein [Actinomadura mexicana]
MNDAELEAISARASVVGVSRQRLMVEAATAGHSPDELAPALRSVQQAMERLQAAVDALT